MLSWVGCGKNGRAGETDERIYVWLRRERGRTANVCRVATYIEPLYTQIQALNLINDRVAAAPPARELDLMIGKTQKLQYIHSSVPRSKAGHG